MIYQRPQTTHARDREIAAMPVRREETASPWFWVAAFLVIVPLIGALLS
jgi:hypothetical protein